MNNKRGKERLRKTRVEIISVLGIESRMAPLGLQFYAADFLTAAKATPSASAGFTPARYYLVCHALELALKAFLSLKGHSLGELARGRFWHDLEEILGEAERNGLRQFVAWGEDETFQIRRASSYYSSKVFEYPALGEALSGYSETPTINVLFEAANTLVAALREPCLQAAH